jgi:hypothetical protein
LELLLTIIFNDLSVLATRQLTTREKVPQNSENQQSTINLNTLNTQPTHPTPLQLTVPSPDDGGDVEIMKQCKQQPS